MATDAPADGAATPRSRRQPQSSSGEAVIETEVGHEQPPNQAEETSFVMKILQHIMLFFLLQNLAGLVTTKFMPSQNSNNVRDDNIISPNHQQGKPIGVTMPQIPPACLWKPGTVMDLSVLITDSPDVPIKWPSLIAKKTTTAIQNDSEDDATNDSSSSSGNILASWQQDGLTLGGVVSNDGGGPKKANKPSILSAYLSSNADQSTNHRNATLTIPMTETIWNNQTHVYAHVFLQRRRTFRDGTDSRDVDENKPVRKDDILIKRMTLTRYRKRKKNRDVKNLLDTPSTDTSSTSAMVDASDSSVLSTASRNKTHDQILLYMKPFVTLQIVDIGSISLPHKKNIPTQISSHMDWYEGGGGVSDDDQGANNLHGPKQDLYYPVLYQSEFWMTSSSLKELNGTVKESKLDINIESVPVSQCQALLSIGKLMLCAHFPILILPIHRKDVEVAVTESNRGELAETGSVHGRRRSRE